MVFTCGDVSVSMFAICKKKKHLNIQNPYLFNVIIFEDKLSNLKCKLTSVEFQRHTEPLPAAQRHI